MVYNIAVCIITYLICGFSPSIEICKLKTGEDIRNLGSGNAGTTNSIRVLGKFMGFVVFILDILKVLVAYGVVLGIGKLFNQDTEATMYSLFMVSAVLGHCYPIYYGFSRRQRCCNNYCCRINPKYTNWSSMYNSGTCFNNSYKNCVYWIIRWYNII